MFKSNKSFLYYLAVVLLINEELPISHSPRLGLRPADAVLNAFVFWNFVLIIWSAGRRPSLGTQGFVGWAHTIVVSTNEAARRVPTKAKSVTSRCGIKYFYFLKIVFNNFVGWSQTKPRLSRVCGMGIHKGCEYQLRQRAFFAAFDIIANKFKTSLEKLCINVFYNLPYRNPTRKSCASFLR